MSWMHKFVIVFSALVLSPSAAEACFSGQAIKEFGVRDYSSSSSSSITGNAPFSMVWTGQNRSYKVKGRISQGSASFFFSLVGGPQLTQGNVSAVYRENTLYLEHGQEFDFNLTYNAKEAVGQNIVVELVVETLNGSPICTRTFRAEMRETEAASLKRLENSAFIAAGVATSGDVFGIKRDNTGVLERVWLGGSSFRINSDLVQGENDTFFVQDKNGNPTKFDLSSPGPGYFVETIYGQDDVFRMTGTGHANPLAIQYKFYKGIVWNDSGALRHARVGNECSGPGGDIVYDNSTSSIWSVGTYFIGCSGARLIRTYWNGSGWTDQNVINWVGSTNQLIAIPGNNVAGTTSNGRLFGTYKTNSGYEVHRHSGLVKPKSAVYNNGDDGLYALTPQNNISRYVNQNGNIVRSEIQSWMGPVEKIVSNEAPNPLFGVTQAGKLFIIYKNGASFGQSDLGVLSKPILDAGSGSDDGIMGVRTDGQFYFGKWINSSVGFQFEYLDIFEE